MIPTTLSAGTSTASSIGNNAGAGGVAVNTANVANTANTTNTVATSNAAVNFNTTNTKELVVGVASLILEGRAFVDDEFHMLSMRQATSPSPPRAGGGVGGSIGIGVGSGGVHHNTDNDNFHVMTSLHGNISGTLACSGAGGIAAVYAGRQSPKPSTSKAATNVQHLVNITTNPHHSFGASSAPLFIETPNSYHSSSSAASSAESTHQRWTQKLCQLRQASPAASLTASYEQKIAIEATQSVISGGNGGEPELVALAIHDPNTAAERGTGAGEFEIVRRVMLSRSVLPVNVGAGAAGSSMGCAGNAGSASPSPSSASDNFLHSLQSLATTCLRGSSPSMMDTSTGYHYATTTTTPNNISGYGSMVSPKYNAYRASTPRFQSPFPNLDLQPGSASSSGSGVQSPKMTSAPPHSRSKELELLRRGSKGSGRMGCSGGTPTSTITNCSRASAIAAINSSNRNSVKIPKTTTTVAAAAEATTATSSTSSSSSSSSTSYPQQGPHCDQFLRKMGLAKGETAEAEDHYCDMSYVNITCSRWRAYCLKMEAIIERCEPICIEVYLGPIGHKVLLEQWIFTFKEKVPPPTMTLPSLCSAIRSQLYFSQISAWCDLIRKSDKSIYDTGRVIFATSSMMGCAGDLVTSTPPPTGLNCCTTPSSSHSSTSSNNITSNITPSSMLPIVTSPNSTATSAGSLDQFTNALLNKRPRLNLFYRIKQYDSTACFNSKPTIHNFPNVNISENCSISVCLKSLPRINGGIPKLGAMMSVPTEHLTTTSNSMVHGVTETTMTTNTANNIRNLPKMSNDGNTTTAMTMTTSTPPPLPPPPSNSKSETKAILLSSLSPSSASASSSSSFSCNGAASVSVTMANANSAFNASNCDKINIPSSSSSSIGIGNINNKYNNNNATTTTANTTINHRYNNNNCQPIIGIRSGSDGVACAPRRVLQSEELKAAMAPLSLPSPGTPCPTSTPHDIPLSLSARSVLMQRQHQQQHQYGSVQKCTFFIDESELSGADGCNIDGDGDRDGKGDGNEDADADADINDADTDDVSDNAHEAQCVNGSCGSLSHREKQLLKYRKRMLKRDKKQQQRSLDCNGVSSCSNNIQQQQDHHNHHHHPQQQYQPMEQGEDDENESEHSSVALVTAREVIKMISTGTQTPTFGCCQRCGNKKSFVCLKCDKFNNEDDEEDQEEMQHQDSIDEMDACSVNSVSSAEIISTPRSKGDLLLQAIQRTPKAAKHKQQASRSPNDAASTEDNSSSTNMPTLFNASLRCATTTSSSALHNNNHLTINTVTSVTPSSSSSSLTSLNSGCQVCKRQKTQHNFNIDSGNKPSTTTSIAEIANMQKVALETNTIDGDGDEQDDYSGGKSIGVKLSFGKEEQTPQKATTMLMPRTSSEIMDEECFASSTKLTPHFDRCALSSVRSNFSTITMVSKPISSISRPPVGMQHTQCQSHTATVSKRSYTPPNPLQLNVDYEFKTPTSAGGSQHQHHQQQQQPHQQQQYNLSCGGPSLPFHQYKPSPKPNLLKVASVYGENDGNRMCCGNSISGGCDGGDAVACQKNEYYQLLKRKGLPKVNLTPIFCNSSGIGNGNSAGCSNSPSAGGCCGSPSPDMSAFSFDTVTINRVKFERAAAAAATAVAPSPSMYTANNNSNHNNSKNTATAAFVDNNNAVPVQKSYSAPTLPNSPSLSPRFAKQAAIYKRRSRHLSDRSDRSSLGSDEQYSDEDLDCGGNGGNFLTPGVLYSSGGSGAASPMKQRARLAANFSRQPLLGNLEECLLQKRITPKTEVSGFKVLLGASGGFCPTQLTIPAAAYFYELHGETLSTPYVCEIRLPRKGYSVPRTGTIQATLLNPLGTVVRMFVIPYDMRDMPPLHQTFIRQRIMADTSTFSQSNNISPNASGNVNVTSFSSSSMLLMSSPLKNSSNNRSPNKGDAKQAAFIDGDNIGDGECDGKMHNLATDQHHNGGGGGGGGGDIGDKTLGHFISAEHMKRLRYSIHLRFQTSRSGRLMLHTDIRLLISRRTDCDTAAAHAKGLLEAPNELVTDTVMPSNPKYSVRQDVGNSGAGSSSRI